MILTILLVIIYLAFISLGLPDSLLGSAWPSMYPKMGVPISYAGIVSMIIAGGTIVSSLFSDKFIKRFGSGIVTTFSVLTTAAALLGFSISNEFYQLCIYAIPLGLGAGSVDAALNNFVALNYKAKHMNWLHSFWGVGAMTGPIIMSYYLKRGIIFQLGYRSVAIIQLSLVLILVLTLPLWKKAKAIKEVKSEESSKGQTKTIRISEIIKLPGSKQALVAFFCYCSIEATTGLWASSYMVMVHDIPVDTAAKWAALFYFGITLGRFLSGFITLKLNNRQMVYLGLSFIIIGLLMMIIPFGQLPLIMGFVITGIGCAPIYPSLLHQTPDNFGAEYSQSIMGVQMACAYVGSTFMPPLFGLIAAKTSYYLLPYFAGGILLLMVIMINLLYKKVKLKLN